MRHLSCYFALIVMASLAACQDSAEVTSPEPGAPLPLFLIDDAAHGGNPHFYFLPPLVSPPHPTGTFDPGLKPVVRVCPLPSCSSDVVTLVSGRGPEDIHVAGEGGAYLVTWHTKRQNLGGGSYRIRVYVGAQLLGYLDFEVAPSSRRSPGTRSESLRVREGRSLLIKFRIERGALEGPSTGRIAFMSYRDGDQEIYLMNPDGQSIGRLTFNPGDDASPAWSSDGTKLAFASSRNGDAGIYFMNADGSGVTRVSPAGFGGGTPTWSPDRSRIAFIGAGIGGVSSIHVINADGSNLHRITTPAGGASDMTPAWSPDGSRIAFVRGVAEGSAAPLADVYLVNPDGTGLVNLTHHTELAQVCCPAWSPDGQKIAYATELSEYVNSEVFVMNRDGSGQTNLTNDPAFDYSPSWSPDGRRLVFNRILPDNNFELFVMDADGGSQANITNHPAIDGTPAWGP